MARSKLEEALKEHGCEVPIVEFQDYLESTYPKHFPQWSIDEMLLHPSEALTFCDSIRSSRHEFATIPDDLILRSLLARRKNPA